MSRNILNNNKTNCLLFCFENVFLFTFFVLFLTDSLQSLRQIRNVRAEMFDCLQSVLKVTGKKNK